MRRPSKAHFYTWEGSPAETIYKDKVWMEICSIDETSAPIPRARATRPGLQTWGLSGKGGGRPPIVRSR